MTDLENCLRRDLNKIAERVTEDSIRPLRVRRARRTRPARLLAPIAAMAAVVAVIAGVSLAAHTGQAPAPATQAGLPLYYVTVGENVTVIGNRKAANPKREATLVVTVRDSVNDAVLTRSSFPRMPLISTPSGLQITGGGENGENGQTFVVSVGSGLFILRVAPDGRSMQLGRFSVPGHPSWNSDPMVLSPNGTTLAISDQQPCKHSQRCAYYTMIRIVSLATGAARTWSTPDASDGIDALAWDGNDHVVFEWTGASPPNGYWLLNVTGPRGGNLLASRVLPVKIGVLTEAESAVNGWQPLITPDGSTIITTTLAGVSGASESIVELSARTGQLLRVVDSFNWIGTTESCRVYTLAPAGMHALIGCGSFFGRLDNNKLTRLPGSPADFQSAAW